MTPLIEQIIQALPALLICFTAIYIFHEGLRFIKQRDNEQRKERAAHRDREIKEPGERTAQVNDGESEALLRLKLQAAERFALYLERIAPDRLVMRLHQNGMSAKMLQADMLRAIREEYDHNLSQQIYVSEKTWQLIKNAKEEMMGFISATGDGLKSSATGMDLSRKLFETASKVENMPHELALKVLRAEVRSH